MSDFAEQYLFVPSYWSHCDWCGTPMSGAARLALVGRILGWTYYNNCWFCPKHRPEEHAEVKRTSDEHHRKWLESLTHHLPSRAAATAELRTDDMPPRSDKESGAFSLVLVIAEDDAFPLAEQLEWKLLQRITATPRFTLTADAQITTLRAPKLPAETREALQPFIWTLQQRFDREGGRWQGEFYPTPIGITFLVAYLE